MISSSSVKAFTLSQTAMDLNLTVFEDVLGGCERIYRTPVPLSYTRLTARFLIVYLFALPWCLVPSVRLGAARPGAISGDDLSEILPRSLKERVTHYLKRTPVIRLSASWKDYERV